MAKKDKLERALKDTRDVSKDSVDPQDIAALEQLIKDLLEKLQELAEGKKENIALEDDLKNFREREKVTEDP